MGITTSKINQKQTTNHRTPSILLFTQVPYTQNSGTFTNYIKALDRAYVKIYNIGYQQYKVLESTEGHTNTALIMTDFYLKSGNLPHLSNLHSQIRWFYFLSCFVYLHVCAEMAYSGSSKTYPHYALHRGFYTQAESAPLFYH